jgi:hypothetical protein
MKKAFVLLSKNEIALLLRAPVIVSFLAAMGNGEIRQWRKVDAIKLAHLKTFTANTLLIPYYKEVERVFEKNFETIAKWYAPFDEPSRDRLQREVDQVNDVIEKLDKELADELRSSLVDYTEHVKKAYKGLVINFVLPHQV